MANEKEIWEIELDIKTNKLTESNLKYEQSLLKVKESEKRLTDSLKAENKQKTADKLSELRVTEAMIKQSLEKELLIIKNNNAQELQLMRQTEAEKRRLRAQSDAQIKAQQKLDSKFTGQSTELGSMNALTQQIAYFKGLRNSVKTNSTEFATYTQKVRELEAEKRVLNGTTSGLTGTMKTYGAGLISLIALQQAYNISLQSSKYQVMRDNFQGMEKDLQAFRMASANTVSDASLIALSNQAADLNINLEDQTILFAFAEKQADKYGTSTEEGFAKVFRIIQGSTKGLKDYGIVTSEFTALTKKLAEEQGKEIDEQIRLEALIKLSNMTYKDAINNTMDMADIHETLAVQVKNVADEHGNFWDVLTSLNPVTGFFNVGLEDMAKNESKAKDDAMLLIGTLNDFNNQVPGWGAATMELRDYFTDLASTFLSTANDAALMQEAIGGTSINRKGGDANIPTQGTGKVKTIKSGSRGSGTTRTTEEKNAIDELIKSVNLELDIKRLLGQMNLKLLIDQKAILQAADSENLKLEDRIKLLEEIEKVQGRIATWLTAGTRGINETDALTIPYQRGNIGKKRFGTGYDPLNDPDNTPADIQALLDAEEEKLKLMETYANSMLGDFSSMLDATGLMSDDVQNFVSWIERATKFLNSSGGIVNSVIGLVGGVFQGPSTAGGSSGGGGGFNGGNMPRIGANPLITPRQNVRNFTMPSKVAGFNGTIVVQGTANEYFEYKVVKIGNEQVSRRGSGVYE